MISVSDGRFPRARLQSPRRCAPAGLPARAIPAGVAVFHYNQTRLKVLIFLKVYEKTGIEKDFSFYTCFNLWAYWTAPFKVEYIKHLLVQVA